jgi:hypothetical protein
MRIFATREIECGGQVRPFKVNLFATARFCEYKGIKLSDIGSRLTDISLLDLMDFAYFAYLSAGGEEAREVFMTWFDDSDLFTEFSTLLAEAFKADDEPVGKPKAKR